MTDPTVARTGPHRPVHGRRRAHRPISLEGLPTAEELAQQTPEQAERYPLYTKEQVEEETRNVRLDTSFGDIIKIRDQWEMIAKVAEIIIKITREHDAGSILQRMNAHREADSLRRTLARLNGKKPRTNTYQER